MAYAFPCSITIIWTFFGEVTGGKRGWNNVGIKRKRTWRPNWHGERSENGFPVMKTAIGLSQEDSSGGNGVDLYCVSSSTRVFVYVSDRVKSVPF